MQVQRAEARRTLIVAGDSDALAQLNAVPQVEVSFMQAGLVALALREGLLADGSTRSAVYLETAARVAFQMRLTEFPLLLHGRP